MHLHGRYPYECRQCHQQFIVESDARLHWRNEHVVDDNDDGMIYSNSHIHYCSS